MGVKLIRSSKDERTAGEKIQQGVTTVTTVSIIGMIVVAWVLARSTTTSAGRSGAVVGVTAFLLFAAAAAVGAGLGFLLGLPRSRFVDENTPSQRTGKKMSRASTFLFNSNLIKVSDWLTTIVIGLGLVNLAKIGPAMRELQSNLADPLGASPGSGTIGVSIVLVATLGGLLLMFLWTTVRVRELFEQSERDLEDEDVPPAPQQPPARVAHRNGAPSSARPDTSNGKPHPAVSGAGGATSG